MLFEWIEFLGWGWLIAAHIVAFGLLGLPFLLSAVLQAGDKLRQAATPKPPAADADASANTSADKQAPTSAP